MGKTSQRGGRTAALGIRLILAIAICGSVAGFARSQNIGQVHNQSPSSPADDAYLAPRIAKDYVQALAKLPDWNGFWQGDRVNGLQLCFDCAHFYRATDPASSDAIGRLPTFPAGSHDTAIPYNAQYQKVYDDIIAKAIRGGDTDPDNCLQPHPTPDAMATGFSINGGVEVIMQPTEVRLTWDWLNATRRIYTDGRPHPSGDDIWSTHMGHSIGRWDGDTLVVDTVKLFAGFYDQTGAPFSDQIHITERIRLIAKDKLEDKMTVEDPVMLTRPYTVRRTFTRVDQPKSAIVGSYCSDQRDSNTAVPASLIK